MHYYLTRNVAVLKQRKRTKRRQPGFNKVQNRILVFLGVITMGKSAYFGNTISGYYTWGKFGSEG